MTSRLCKFQCGTLLEGFDETARKYIEAGSGGLHTKERCEAAKAQARVTQGAKNNHGNELVQNIDPNAISNQSGTVLGYKDHTQGPKLKLRIFTQPTPGGLEIEYNNFAAVANIRFSQYQVAGSLYTIAVWFEEIPLKQ